MAATLNLPAPFLGHQRLWRWRGWRIRYSFAGPPANQTDKPPILLLHGFGANLNQWRYNLGPLSQQYPIYALDLLGFGGSEKAATLYNSEFWAEQVYDFWRDLVGRPAILMGHSLGALVALTTAFRQPQIAAGLVMITLPLAREDLVAGWVAKLARTSEKVAASPLLVRLLFYGIRNPNFLRRALRSIYTHPDKVDQTVVDLFAHPPRERGASRTLAYLVRSRTEPHYSPSTMAMARSLQVPALLLWGSQDRVIPYGWAKEIASQSQHINFKTVPNGGHCCYDEHSDTINPIILNWLGDLPTS